ncbi:hypothetical protein [Methanobrevibacter sp.]|uniref:hypothetical protein n=1 Tax=Methanobrevibacter sp. TaxID=66852 RepID=UPI0026DEE620|nr:hypothetical protein [Methanobrevibacter sp.]MDO5859651.1 hypothetical protein [Methanobrevibacter sp.]
MVDDTSKMAEINRLKAPLKYDGLKVYDANGNQVNCIETLSGLKFIVEPNSHILNDEEILEYAPNSKEASKIRLKRGVGSNSDVMLINDSLYWILGLYYTILICIAIPVFYTGNRMGMFLILILAILPLLYLYYIFNLKQYKDANAKKQTNKSRFSTPEIQKDMPKEGLKSLKKYADEVEDLKVIFDSKEIAVRDLIEKCFEPPQITYDRFMTTIDKSHDLFYHEADSALNITQLAVEDTPRVKNELNTKINTLKSIIDHIEDLINELVINLSSDDKSSEDVKNLADDMENLIDSVKEYN